MEFFLWMAITMMHFLLTMIGTIIFARQRRLIYIYVACNLLSIKHRGHHLPSRLHIAGFKKIQAEPNNRLNCCLAQLGNAVYCAHTYSRLHLSTAMTVSSSVVCADTRVKVLCTEISREPAAANSLRKRYRRD